MAAACVPLRGERGVEVGEGLVGSRAELFSAGLLESGGVVAARQRQQDLLADVYRHLPVRDERIYCARIGGARPVLLQQRGEGGLVLLHAGLDLVHGRVVEAGGVNQVVYPPLQGHAPGVGQHPQRFDLLDVHSLHLVGGRAEFDQTEKADPDRHRQREHHRAEDLHLQRQVDKPRTP